MLTSRLKSLSRSTFMLYFCLYSLSEYVESTLIGSTTRPCDSNALQSSRISHSSAVHVGEKASGKNATRTGCPRNRESVTRSPDVDGSVKSGAGVPTDGGAF